MHVGYRTPLEIDVVFSHPLHGLLCGRVQAPPTTMPSLLVEKCVLGTLARRLCHSTLMLQNPQQFGHATVMLEAA
jgi:hypothetical protein